MLQSWIEKIAEREQEVGAPTLERMTEIFVRDSKTQLEAIAAAIAREDLRAAQRAVHDLVSNAGSLCFNHLYEAAAECQRACAEGNIADAKRAAKGLPALVAICVTQVHAHYKRH